MRGWQWLKTDDGDPIVWELARNLKNPSMKVPKALAKRDLVTLFVVISGLSVLIVCIFVLAKAKLDVSNRPKLQESAA